jgi:hypothetical protein
MSLNLNNPQPFNTNLKTLTESWGRYTVKELSAADSSSVALRQMVAARANLQLLTRVDARQAARVELMPEGAGLTYNFQKVTVTSGMSSASYAPGSGDVTSGDLVPADPTLAAVAATIATFAAASFIEDKMQRQSAVNFAELYGVAQGNSLNYQINLALWSEIVKATTNTIKEVLSAHSKNYTWDDINNGIGAIEAQRGIGDIYMTYPFLIADGASGSNTGFRPFIQSNITSIQFTTGLSEFMKSGMISQILGLKVMSDASFAPVTYACADGAVMGAILQSNEAVGWAQASDIISAIQRWELKTGFYLVSNCMAAAKLIKDQWVTLIEHTNS